MGVSSRRRRRRGREDSESTIVRLSGTASDADGARVGVHSASDSMSPRLPPKVGYGGQGRGGEDKAGEVGGA